MKNQRGFTLVELIVVLAILGILTIIAVFNYTNVQRQARDEQRSADATVVAESLEKYFTQHGEYPSVAQITNSNGSAVKQLLGLTGLDSLLAPLASGGTTNSWTAGTASSSNQLTYSGNTDTSASCNTGTAATDRCNDFRIQYFNEQEGTTVTITSRNKSVAVNPTEREGVISPDAPSVSVALAGSSATATASAVECQIGATPRYSFQNRTNDGSWSGWTGWSTSATSAVTAGQGMKYGFRAKSQCQVGTVVSSDSPISPEGTYIHPINTPATPNVWITASFRPNHATSKCLDAASGGTAAGTAIQLYDCNGTAAQDWSYDSGDGTLRRSDARTTCIQDMGKGAQLRLQNCNGSTSQRWNANASGWYVNASSNLCIDVASWGTANGTAIVTWDCTNATIQIWNPTDSQSAWTWTPTSCPAGTTVRYQARNLATGLATSSWFSTGATPRTVRTTVNQGHTYTTEVQAQCYSAYDTSNWSGVGSSWLVKAVYKPGDAYGWAFSVWGGRNGLSWSWASPACGAGTNKSYIEDNWVGLNNNSGGSLYYWLAPRTPNGPGNVWWWTANSTGGAAYIWYSPDGNDRGSTYVDRPSGNMPYGVDVRAQTQYRCVNPVTGRSATGDWTVSPVQYT